MGFIMWKSVFVVSIFLLFGCQDRTAIELTVKANVGALAGNKIFSLRVVLSQDADSGVEVFDNGGKEITFPVTLSTRINADRRGDLRIGVSGLNQQNQTVIGGFDVLVLDGKEQQAFEVDMDNGNPCVAGDGTDINCCSNFLDDDGNGLADCDESACKDAFPDLCEGSTCGDGIINAFAAEQCDDGNNNPADDCNLTCISEDLIEFGASLQVNQVFDPFSNVSASGITNNSYQVQDGFVFTRTIGDCTRTDLLVPSTEAGADFFFADFGANRILDGQNNELLSLQFPIIDETIFKGFAPNFVAGDPIEIELQGGAAFDLAQPKTLFTGNFPTKLTLNAAQVEDTLFRGEDYTLTWTSTPGNVEQVVAVISSGNFSTQIFCQADDAQEQLVVDGELTQGFNRGPIDFLLRLGFTVEIGHGVFIETPLTTKETTNQADASDGVIFFGLIHGTRIVGTVL
jgi:cysteine-rich repeat protein